jgi:PAS domain S-box-containing protein
MRPATTPAPLGQATPLVDDGYRLVFQGNPTPMWVFSLDTYRFLAVNTAAVTEYGYPPDEFLTLTIEDVYQPPDLAFSDGLARDAKDLYTGSWVHRRRDGTTLQVEIQSSDLIFQGRRARLIHVTNATARLQAEATCVLDVPNT